MQRSAAVLACAVMAAGVAGGGLFYRRRELPARLCVAGSADLNSLCQLSDDVFYLQAKEQRLSGRTCLWVFDMKAKI